MNVVDIERAPLHDVVERVRAEAASRGVAASGGELVGLVPESVLLAAANRWRSAAGARRVASARARSRIEGVM